MKRNFKKTLSLILAVLTLASCFSTLSFAAEVDYGEHTGHNVIKLTGTPAVGCTNGLTDGYQCLACEGEPVFIPQEVKPAPHNPGEWEIEEEKVTDCTVGYNKVIKCKDCKIVLKRESITEHSFKTDSVEQPNCEVAGIAYKTCEVCGEKITQPVEPRLHSWGTDAEAGWVIRVVGTCTIDGVQTRDCALCLKVEERKIIAPGHQYDPVLGSDKTPTCKEDGKGVDYLCRNCGDKIVGNPIGKRKHIDEDNDNHCDVCDLYVTDELPEGCSCPCHEKSGIRKLLFQIAIFFLSIFGVGATCSCGAVHYEARNLF